MNTTKHQPFCNTADVVKRLKEFNEIQCHAWHDSKLTAEDFALVQDMILAERKYLADFWGDDNCVNLKKFYRWNCEQAFYDLPIDRQDYAASRGRYQCSLVLDKYDVFHQREEYLDELLSWLFSMFHDWQFCTQGWTAYHIG